MIITNNVCTVAELTPAYKQLQIGMRKGKINI